MTVRTTHHFLAISWRSAVFGTGISIIAVPLSFVIIADMFLTAAWVGYGTVVLICFSLIAFVLIASYFVGVIVARMHCLRRSPLVHKLAVIVLFWIAVPIASAAVVLLTERSLLAPKGSPHLERCTPFRFLGNQIVAENICDEDVFVQFLGAGQPAISRTLAPGETFPTGWEYRGSYVFATCPAGQESSVPFSEMNRYLLRESQYRCVPQ